jgi:hypothetical protein
MNRKDAVMAFKALDAELNWELTRARIASSAPARADAEARILDVLEAQLKLRDEWPDVRLNEVPAA